MGAPLSPTKKQKTVGAGSTLQNMQDIADAILESSQNYNKITDLLKHARKEEATSADASSALCKVFSSLWIQGRLKRNLTHAKASKQVLDWLLGRYSEFLALLMVQIRSGQSAVVRRSLALVMRLIQAEVESNPELIGNMWQRGTFQELLSTCTWDSEDVSSAEVFVDMYVTKYEDVKVLMLRHFTDVFELSDDPAALDQCINILARIGEASLEPAEDTGTSLLFTKKRHFKKNETERRMGEAWLVIMRQPLGRDNRRRLLDIIPTHIEPSVSKPELLLDFLSSCCDCRGTEAIMALQGLYRLIADHGLDYPLLYHKLYALLDNQSLHKKYRSRFLRLVNTFLSSTHLPATLVASFIKRMSRLALHSPPAAIVAIAPLIYNLMQEHPACTPMLHRAVNKSGQNDQSAFQDPFDEEEQDPNLTGAVDSSLWELDTLRIHWHPNVATIAKILGEQFLKRSYNLEDFLDHSYGSLLDTEVSKTIVKAPALEYQIPKRIFIHDPEAGQGDLMRLWTFT